MDLSLKLHHSSCNGVICGAGCCELESVNQAKYLGVTVDRHLKWDGHLNYLVPRARKLIYVFVKLRDILSEDMLKTVYYALAQSLFQYGISSWGAAYNNIINPLEIVQKRIIKIILKHNILYPSLQLFSEFKVLSIRQLFLKEVTLTFIKRANFQATEREIITRNVEAGQVTVPCMKTTAGQRSAIYLAPLVFNLLPQEIKESKFQDNFKFILRRFLTTETGRDVVGRIGLFNL